MLRKRLVLSLGAVVVIVVACVVGRSAYDKWVEHREEALKTQCRATYESDDWDRLEQLAREWLDLNPESADAWIFLADAAKQRNDLEHTVEYLKRVPRSDPKVVDALAEAINIEFGPLNRPLEGARLCEEVLGMAPRTPIPRQRLIFFHALTLQRVKMIAQIRQALELQCEAPEAYAYLVLSDHLSFTNGFKLNSQWLQEAPESELFLVARAVQMSETLSKLEDQTLESDEQRSERTKLMNQYLKQYPSNPPLLRHFLALAVEQSDIAEVGRLLKQVAPESSEDSVFWRYRGWYYAAVEDFEQAEVAYRKAGMLFRLDWHVWHELAAVLRRKGELDEAEYLERVALEGKTLRKELMQLPDVSKLTPEILERIGNYAEHCGDNLVAEAVRDRLHGG